MCCYLLPSLSKSILNDDSFKHEHLTEAVREVFLEINLNQKTLKFYFLSALKEPMQINYLKAYYFMEQA